MKNWISKMGGHVRALICVLILIMLFSCQEDDALPSISQEGKNTFGCRVDGELYLSKPYIGRSNLFIYYNTTVDTVGMTIYARNYEINDYFIFNIWDIGNFETDKKYEFPYYYSSYANSSFRDYTCNYDSAIYGNIQLSTFDLENGIVAGIFELTTRSTECQDTVNITEGRFDIGHIMRE